MVASRCRYVVDFDSRDRPRADLVCRAVCEVVRPAAGVAYVDAYSDYRDELPVVVADAQRELRELGRRRGTGDPGMAVELDPADDGQGSC